MSPSEQSKDQEPTLPEAKPQQPARRNWIHRMLLIIALSLTGFVIVYAAALYFLQDRLIYHPRSYGAGFDMIAKHHVIQIPYTTSQGRQVALYRAASPQAVPQRLWVFFHGNGSLAFDWVDVLETIPDPQAGYLLIDYPGYGLCEGQPWDHTILESTQAAVQALAGHFKIPLDLLTADLNLVGYSLGGAAALQWAVTQPSVHRIVLISTFTSIHDMARLTVGWPLCYLVKDDYDNQARLRELAQRSSPPQVTLFHGTQDPVVPFDQGEALAECAPAIAHFVRVNGLDHNFIIDAIGPQLAQLLATAESNQ